MAAEVPPRPAPPPPTCSIVETRVYRGAQHLVLRARRSTSSSTSACLEDYPTDTLPGFTDRLVELLPGLERHTCSHGRRGRLRRAAARGHLARPRRRARRAAAADGGRPRPAPRQDPRGQGPARASTTSSTATPTRTVGLAAGRLAVRLVNHLVAARRRASTSPTELDAFLTPGRAHGLRPVDRGHPRGGGQPRHPVHPAQQRPPWCSSARACTQQRIRATMTSKTGALAVDIAGDKDLTTKLLGSAGLPVPKQETVRTAARRGRGGPADRLPGRRQAARRQPRPRGVPRPAERRRGRRRPSTSPRPSRGAATSSSSRS